jgi:hypothetical protein
VVNLIVVRKRDRRAPARRILLFLQDLGSALLAELDAGGPAAGGMRPACH